MDPFLKKGVQPPKTSMLKSPQNESDDDFGILFWGGMCYNVRNGSVSEWFKEHDWKSCERATVPEVRILSLPPWKRN